MNRLAAKQQKPKSQQKTKKSSITSTKRSLTTATRAHKKSTTTITKRSPLLTHSKRSFAVDAASLNITPAAASGSDESVEFPKTMADRTFSKKVPMPFPRGQTWGQTLLNNQQIPTPTGTWTTKSRRSGMIMTKLGMISMFDQYGMRHGVTVLDLNDCQVMRMHPNPNRLGLFSLELGAANKREKGLTKPLLGHFHRCQVQAKQYVESGLITGDATLPTGWQFDVRHFMVGQFIDVHGTSKGKGFQGVMKRYGFGGQPATHGVSVTHRSLGSTGCRQDPGKVFKNKKMPGHMGLNNIVFENVQIMKIDPQRQLIYVKGQIPGPVGASIYACDAHKRPFAPENPPPFPTFIPPADDALEILQIPNELLGSDPYANGEVA